MKQMIKEILTMKTQKLPIATKLLYSVVSIALASLPLGLFCLIWKWLKPVDFYQKFILVGSGVFTVGALQVVFIIALIMVMVAVWES